ncbi:MAG: hypothetical protein EOM20_13650 [Spartobacteria bacterium]|nr:hypothetical protein [Spartobacteria bacterium]
MRTENKAGFACIAKRMLQMCVFAALVMWMFLSVARGELPAFLRAADLSFMQQLEAEGAVFRSEGQPGDLLQILMSNGLNAVRLRLWHTPADGWNNLSNTLVVAQRVHDAGLPVILDIHYSDTWADPGHQTKPAAWSALSPELLAAAVRDYTGDVISNFAACGFLPDAVQIGNEISGGFLWNEGRVGGSYETNWTRFTDLLKAAVEGLTNSLAPTDHVDMVLHIDSGGNNAACRWFFDRVTGYGVPFDIIALSYYPWWHGTLSNLESNIADLAVRYGKDIIVMETAYPWTLEWSDATHNVVGDPSQLEEGFPATPVGQQEFLCAIRNILPRTAGAKGRGFCYWGAEYITVEGVGSSWENLALFDFQTNLLAAARAFSATGAVCESRIASVSESNQTIALRISGLSPGTTVDVESAVSLVAPVWNRITAATSISWAAFDVAPVSMTETTGFIRLTK